MAAATTLPFSSSTIILPDEAPVVSKAKEITLRNTVRNSRSVVSSRTML